MPYIRHQHGIRFRKIFYVLITITAPPAPDVRVRPAGSELGLDPGHFVHVSMTTPVVSALKNCYIQSPLIGAPCGGFAGPRWRFRFRTRNHRTAVSEVKRPLRGGSGSEAAKNLTAIHLADIPQRAQVSVLGPPRPLLRFPA
jgi:hypothetical protein